MDTRTTPLSVALVGCGVVGGATALLLTRDRGLIARKTGLDISLAHIVDRDFARARSLGLDPGLFRPSIDAALADPRTRIVVELAGGIDFARTVILRAARAGKHVVTANKALLAHHGPELFAAAREAGVTISFEASCGGGIPIVRALYDGLVANRIDAIHGIVNGTCNHILTAMSRRGMGYAEALAEAQAAGLAEADPALDVSGMDSAHKIAILASLAFGTTVELSRVETSGIDSLEAADVAYGQALGYVVKLLATAERVDGALACRVRPSFISREHPLAWVSGPFNAVSVYGHATGHTMYYGRGAGGPPTASAVVADIVSAGNGAAACFGAGLGLRPGAADLRPAASAEVSSRYYLRLAVDDHPGVLAQVTAILARHRVSISSVLQKEMPEQPAAPPRAQAGPAAAAAPLAPVVIITHRVAEGALAAAAARIAALESVRRPPVLIPIVDEKHEDFQS